MNLKMFGDRILVRKLGVADARTKDNIILPKGVRESGGVQTMRGEVLLVGDGQLGNDNHITMDVKVGDIVHYPSVGGLKLDMHEDACQDYVILMYKECIGKELNGK